MLIFDRLLKILANFDLIEIDISRVTTETTLMGDLGLSSVEFVMLACAIDEEFGIDIEFDDMPTIVTFGDACRYVEGLLIKMSKR